MESKHGGSGVAGEESTLPGGRGDEHCAELNSSEAQMVRGRIGEQADGGSVCMEDREGEEESGGRKELEGGDGVIETEEGGNSQEDEEGDNSQEDDDGCESSDTLDTTLDTTDDDDSPSASENEGGTNFEAPLTDAEVEELVSEFLSVESKAAEAQETLEKESLAKLESEVRAELAENFQGSELEIAVAEEMKNFVGEWETVLDDLETQSSLLLEQLDEAGIELPSLYKWIEIQAPSGCCTDAWKKRIHWVGTQVTDELNESVRTAEEYLKSVRPVSSKHGKVLEEGASGFLTRKLSLGSKETYLENCEKDWSSFNGLIQSQSSSNNTSYGSIAWASVYLASTPKQAASLGLNLPGIDEVDEIGEIECSSSDPFYAAAVENEKEIDLSEEQKKNFRKVREEDDANTMRKMQLHLKQRRQKSQYQVSDENNVSDTVEPSNPSPSRNVFTEDARLGDKVKTNLFSGDVSKETLTSNLKRPRDDEVTYNGNKRFHTVIIDSDDDVQFMDGSSNTNSNKLDEDKDEIQEPKENVEVIDVDMVPSPGRRHLHSLTAEDIRTFHCTACSAILMVSEVQRHPLLEVIVCDSCKSAVEDRMQNKDIASFGSYCAWCGKFEALISCRSCKKQFCEICISRNFGNEHLLEAKSGWRCSCCLPILLHPLVLECDHALGVPSDFSSDSGVNLSTSKIGLLTSNVKKQKKKIRRIIDDTELGEQTKEKIAIEKARQEHLKSMQVQSAGKSRMKTISNANGNAIEIESTAFVGDAIEGYIVNVAREDDEEPVRLPPSICGKLKPHQIAGIRFLWENIIQSVRKVKSGDKGLGCILAHTMGLGKTFQVISFLYAAMRCADLGLRTALIVTPVNVLHNWRQEFIKWKPLEVKPLRVLMLEDVSRERRHYLVKKWRTKGGVLLIGYASFRNLSLGRHIKDRNIAIEIRHALQHGPDFLICDEAHMIKNTNADTTQTLKQVKTQRRIALTGSPLQNNLMEYYCMVDFIREGFLGSSHEFRNRFQNPIENGQHANSTSSDVKIMNQRSHILYEQLKGFVQRMDTSVMKKDLPPKTVFVITVKLSPLQKKLYRKFLDVHWFSSEKISAEKSIKRCFFKGYQTLAQVWNHPGLLQLAKEQRSLRKDVENIFMDDESSDDNLESNDMQNGEMLDMRNDMTPKQDVTFDFKDTKWWEGLVDEKIYKEVNYSGKMVLLLDILSMSAEVGDKVLVFSQSLPTLDLIELFLSRLPRKGNEGQNWKPGKDWYRLDGSTEGSKRQMIVENFNEPTNRRVKCTLISTRAGSLGINLHAANRVVIIDGSWNPTYDLQAIYRAWRYGQKKPVYAYRLMAHGTMEEKIYKRQVTKEGLAARVVDRQQIHRTMSKEEMLHLFDFGYDESSDAMEQSQENYLPSDLSKVGAHGVLVKHSNLANPATSEKFMECLLKKYYPCWIANYHEHETLLQENEAEKLSKEEQDMAWQTYQQTLEWEEVHKVSVDDCILTIKKSAASMATSERNPPQQMKGGSNKGRSTQQKKCTNLAHLLTLRSNGTKSGTSTICRECSQEISWETLNREGKSR